MAKRPIRLASLTLLAALTGFAQSGDDEVEFWEWPYPERSVIVSEFAATLEPEVERESARLEFLVELQNERIRKQWIVTVERSNADSSQEEPQVESNRFYCSTGDVFEFRSVLQPLHLTTRGPAIMKKGKLSRKSRLNKEVREEVYVLHDFLLLGFDRIADLTLKLDVESRSKVRLQIRTEPFPSELASVTKAQFEELEIGLGQIRSIAGLAPSLNSFFYLLMSTPGVQDILMEVVDKPSFFSLVTKGLNVNFKAGRKGVASENPQNWGLDVDTPCYRLPITIELNGKAALYSMLIVRSPEELYSLTAGVVGIIAYKPDDPSRVLSIRLCNR